MLVPAAPEPAQAGTNHHRMANRFRVSLLGFSGPERNTLSSYFRLAGNRNPSYEQVQLLTDADFVVADADHAPSVQLVQATERLPDTLFVGAQAPVDAVAHVPRPIEPLLVLRELDLLAVARLRTRPPAAPGGGVRTLIQPQLRPRRQAAAASPDADPDAEARPAPPPPLPIQLTPLAGPLPPMPPMELLELRLPAALHQPAPRVVPPVAPPVAPAVAPPVARPVAPPPVVPPPPAPPPASSAPPAPAAIKSPPAPATPKTTRRAAAPPPAQPVNALLIDDSDVALRFLQRRLQRFAMQTECAANSSEALRLLDLRGYDFVFLDMELGEASELDGLALCRRIKRDFASRVPPPTVVMVTAHHGEMDRVRGTLAGCDAFLGKPLDEAELERLLLRHGLRPTQPAAE